MGQPQPHYPERAPIDAYGNGGFRFAEARQAGSLLIVPSGMHGWEPNAFKRVTRKNFTRVFEEAEGIDFLLFGTGIDRHEPSQAIKKAFAKAGIGLEVMNTGAACRTYNVLLGEQRAVAAALIAVE